MPPIERDVALYDTDRVLRHQHSSSSDHGRSLIPMWDSSDPERAPPPLPLNPQSPSVGASRPGTSAAIQSAHAALTEKARETALVSNVLSKRMGEASPERTPRASLSHTSSTSTSNSTPRSQSHRRMQSLQPNSVRDLSLMLENGAGSSGRDLSTPAPRSPEKAPRPSTPLRMRCDPFVDDERPNPGPGPSLTPIIRPIVRRPHQSILGENTPPQSATMMALHSMASNTGAGQREVEPMCAPLPALPYQESPAAAEPEPAAPVPVNAPVNSSAGGAQTGSSAPLPNTGNTSNGNNLAMAVHRQMPVPLDQLSKQMLSLTNIATSLQKEMSALSRRSRDNATDLLSLKQATNARDEDIRKSLRELLTNVSETNSIRSRDSYTGGPYLIDSKPHGHSATSPLSKSARPFSLPRIPSPNSFAASLDRESMSTPSLCGADGPNTMAMLERIVRDMGTREGQDLLVKRLSDVLDKLVGMASAAKLEELLEMLKDRQHKAVVSTSDVMVDSTGGSGRPRAFSFDEPTPSHLELEYSHKGPMTQRAERLLQSSSAPDHRRSSAPPSGVADVINDDILKIIKTVKDSVAQGGGLTAEVKALVRELRGEVLGMGREIGRRLDEVEVRARDEGKPAAATQAEMSKVIEDGLSEMKQHMNSLMREHRRQSAVSTAAVAAAAAEAVPTIDYQEVYNSMRAALKDSQANKPHKPELSRDDVIEAVKDAWETYKPEIEVQQIGLERDEVLACLEEGLRDYAPRDDKPAGATRDEVFKAVVEGLKHFVPPQMPASGMSRDEVLGAVRECLEEFEFPVAPSALGADITKEDMVDAVKEGLNGFDFPRPPDNELVPLHAADGNEEVIARLHEIMQCMREEFKAVSDEAKENVAAHGRDTEQVLDATRDGLEKLRADLESYVDKVSAAPIHQDFAEGLIRTLDVFRDEIADLVSKASDNSKQMLKSEIESLRDAVNSSLVPAIPTPPVASNSNSSNKEVLEALHDAVNALRGEISSRHVNSTSEVLDAIQEGLSDLRTSIEKLENKPIDFSANDEILDALREGLSDVRADIGNLRDQNGNTATPFDSSMAIVPVDMLKHDDIKNLEMLITQLRTKVDILDAAQSKLSADRELSTTPATRSPAEDAHESETSAWKEKLSEMETKLHAIHDSIAGLANRETEADATPAPRAATDAASREDVEAIETILRNTKARLDDLIDGEQLVRKDHIDAVEALVLETKVGLGDLKSHMEGLSSREDVHMVESLIAQVANGFEEMKERHEKQLEDPEKVTKSDVDAVALACLQVKSAVEKMSQADDSTGLPSKDDLLSLAVIVRDVRSQLETDATSAARATEEHQAEIIGVGERVRDVKDFLEALNETIKTRLEDGVLGIESVGKILDSLSDTVGRNNSDLHDLYETMRNEFEESRAGVVGAKLESDERFQQTTEILEAKIDDRIGELMARFDDFEAAADDRTKAGEARDIEVEAAVIGTRTVADELKLLIDTLGSAVTESLEKMEEASKTVFTRVDEMVSKAEENHADDKAEHQQTRDHVQQAIEALQSVEGQVGEYQPQILETIKDVLVIVSEHFEQSKSSTAAIQEQIIEARPEQQLLPPVEKYDDTTVQEKLDRLVSQTDLATNAYSKLDKMDALVDHTLAIDEALTKLDRLVEHSEDTDKALVQLTKLDELDKLEKLDYLIAQSDTTTQALATLEKLTKLDQIVDLSQLAGRAFDAQHAKIDKLIDHSQLARDAYAKLESLEKLAKLDQLDELVEQSRTADSKADQMLSQLEKLEQLEQLEQLEKLAKLDQLDELVEHSHMVDAKADQTLSQLEQLRELEKLDKLEKLDELFSVSCAVDDKAVMTLSQLEKLDKLEKLEKLEQLDKLDDLMDRSRIADDKADRTLAQLDQLEKLDKLEKLEKLEKLDQLDELIDHSRTADDKADKTLSQLETLEKVHEQVMRTAADLAQYMVAQTERSEDDRRESERLLQEAAIALERQQAEKKQAEASVAALQEEERRLRESVASLRSDQESLQRNKMKLTGDVSSLETALHLRREELYEMETRAAGLERRILEGVMDHSRVLLMAKANKGREAMSRKRVVPSKNETALGDAGATKRSTKAAPAESRPRAALNMALSAKRSPMLTNSPVGVAANGSVNGSRRILSLSQLNSSVSNGSIKRSNSVRTNVGGGGGLRKSSWGGRLPTKGYGSLEMDKENAPLKESDEEDDHRGVREASIDAPVVEEYHTPPADEISSAVVPYRRRGMDDETEETLRYDGDSCSDDGRDGGHDASHAAGCDNSDCHSDEDEDHDNHSVAGTLRRSSHGTSVVTGETQSESGEYYSGDEYDDDVMSQWTSSQLSSAAPGEMVLYGSEQ